MYLRWDNPRRWCIRLYGPMTDDKVRWRHHKTIYIISDSAHKAIEKANALFPEYRLESCADTGTVDFILDFPKEELK